MKSPATTLQQLYEEAGDDHVMSSVETPLRPDAFLLSDAEKITIIEDRFRDIMHALGLDLNDDSLKGTPYRVAKMYVQEIFSGLNPKNKPEVKVFDNPYHYEEMIVEKNIRLHSSCEHHFLPIIGKVHVAYIAAGKVIGLSKIHRIVNYYGRRPQVQERLSLQLVNALKTVLDTEDVAVIIESEHLCVSTRGIKDPSSATVTSAFHGKFREAVVKDRLIGFLHS